MPLLTTPALAAGTLAARDQPEIAGDGLVLRPWTAADRATVVTAYTDPAIQRWHCRSMDDDEAAAWLAQWDGRWQAETGASWAVCQDSHVAEQSSSVTGQSSSVTGQSSSVTGQIESVAGQIGPVARQVDSEAGQIESVVGQIGLRRLDLAEGLAEISYWVLPAARGRRVAPRALRALTGWAFGTLGLHRLELHHSTANFPSCRVAELSGFMVEGTKRAEARHADGWHDMHAHARLSTDPSA